MCVNDCMCVVKEMKITVDDVGTGDNDDERERESLYERLGLVRAFVNLGLVFTCEAEVQVRASCPLESNGGTKRWWEKVIENERVAYLCAVF